MPFEFDGRVALALTPIAASPSHREGDWNDIRNVKTSLLNEMTAARTYRPLESYVSRVYALWLKFTAAPSTMTVTQMSFRWRVGRSQTVTVHCLAHEVLLTCFRWVQEDLIQKKEGQSRTSYIRDLIKAARVARWLMLPMAKMVHATELVYLTETGCEQLLRFSLVLLMTQCVYRAEANDLLGNTLLGMAGWVIREAEFLTKVGNVNLSVLMQEMRAIQILYVEPDDPEHDIALATEAALRFTKLNDAERLKKARSRASEFSDIKPTSQHRKIKLVGPSDIDELNDPVLFPQ